MARRAYGHFPAVLIAANAILLGCGGGGDGSTPPPDNVTSVAKTTTASGDAQSGAAGQVLPAPIQVVVTTDGSPAAGATVNWATGPGGGAMTPASGQTGADGVASSSWTLGTLAGSQVARATVSGATGSPVTFTATALPAAAAALTKGTGDAQSGETNAQLAQPVQAKVADQFGNAVSGVPVNWSATGASVSAPTVASDAAGISQVSVTLGSTAGPITIIADAAALIGSPLTFNATATEPLPTPTSITVRVRDNNFFSLRNGTVNPAVDTVLAGGTVTWAWEPASIEAHDVTSTGTLSFNDFSPPAIRPPPYTVTFASPGTYNYFCTQHGLPASGMRGQIVVK